MCVCNCANPCGAVYCKQCLVYEGLMVGPQTSLAGSLSFPVEASLHSEGWDGEDLSVDICKSKLEDDEATIEDEQHLLRN